MQRSTVRRLRVEERPPVQVLRCEALSVLATGEGERHLVLDLAGDESP